MEIINKGYYDNNDRELLTNTCQDDVPYVMVVAVKNTGDFYQFFTDAVSEHYPDLHMVALSIQPAVINHIPRDNKTPDLALKAIANWDYAYRYLDGE